MPRCPMQTRMEDALRNLNFAPLSVENAIMAATPNPNQTINPND